MVGVGCGRVKSRGGSKLIPPLVWDLKGGPPQKCVTKREGTPRTERGTNRRRKHNSDWATFCLIPALVLHLLARKLAHENPYFSRVTRVARATARKRPRNNTRKSRLQRALIFDDFFYKNGNGSYHAHLIHIRRRTLKPLFSSNRNDPDGRTASRKTSPQKMDLFTPPFFLMLTPAGHHHEQLR